MFYQNNPYECFFLDETEFNELCNNLECDKQKNISFLGHLITYDQSNNIGIVSFKGKKINVNFSRVSNIIQLKNKNPLIMVYGFIQKNKKKEITFYCNLYRYIETDNKNFDFEEYRNLCLERRKIMRHCEEISESNEFWYGTNNNLKKSK